MTENNFLDDEEEFDLSDIPPITAMSTSPGSNRFKVPLYLRVSSNRTLRPVDSKHQAHYTVVLEIEYPTYEDELMAKKEATRYDEYHSVHFVEQDHISEWRVRRCLVRWNFHKVVPNFTKRIIRQSGILEDNSMAIYKALPPLIRKAIVMKLWDALGAP
jgi:hypothetical protein